MMGNAKFRTRSVSRDHEHPHHGDSMQREHPVVDLGIHDGAFGGEQLCPNEEREDAPQDEHQHDDTIEHYADALVIGGEQPRGIPASARR